MENEQQNIEPESLTPCEQWELYSALNREHVTPPDVDAAWRELNERLELEDVDQESRQPLFVRMRPLLHLAAGIAAAIALIVGFRYWNNQGSNSTGQDTDMFALNVPDSVTEVTLTTADGYNREVKKESLAFNQQSQVVKAGDMMALSTPRGKDYHLTLSDGTQVWLNADSRIEFPETFGSESRQVKVHGEVYFEVKKDANRPFIVHTDYFTTRVLGTSFNVRAISQRDASVTLVGGRIQIKAGDQEQVLSPGQQASLAGTGLKVQSVDTYPITQWKEGFFYFDNQSLFKIMQELARWYGVNVSFDDTSKMDVKLHFVAERDKSLTEVIKSLNAMEVAHVEMEGKTVVIN